MPSTLIRIITLFRPLSLLILILVCSWTPPVSGQMRFSKHLHLPPPVLRDAGLLTAPPSDSGARMADRSLVPPPVWHECITNIPGDAWEFTKVSFSRDALLPLAGVGVLTAALMATDDITYTIGSRWYREEPIVKTWSDIFVSFGDGKSQFGMAGAFGVYGLIAGDNRALRTGSQIIEVVLGAGAVVQVLKHITGRESPFVASQPTGLWRWFPDQIEYHKKVPHYDAFPSGHVCTSVATVVVIAENYPDVWWIRPVGLTLAGLVGVGMVNYGIHWYSDYPLAVVIGYLFGTIAAHPEIWRSSDTADAVSLRLVPVLTSQQAGMGLVLGW